MKRRVAESPSRRAASGMTLLEVIVGLAITGIAVSAGYGALASVLDQRDRAEQILSASLQAANIRRELRQWLAGARLTIEEDGPGFRGLDGVWEGGGTAERRNGSVGDDAVTFLTTASTPLQASDVIVHIAVDRDPETKAEGLIASFKTWRGKDETVIEVDSRVQGLEIRYFSLPLGDRGWLPSWISRSMLPSGIEVTLIGDSLPALLTLPMLVPLGASR